MTTAHLLLEVGSISSSRKMYEHALALSEKSRLTECAMQCIAALRRISANTEPVRVLRAFDRRMTMLEMRLHAEVEAEGLVDQGRALLREYTLARVKTLRTLNGVCSRLKQLKTQHSSSFVVSYAYFRVNLWRASLVGDVADIMRFGSQGVRYMNAHPLTEAVQYRVEFEGARLSAALYLKDHAASVRVWSEIQQKIVIGSGNWVTLLQLHFLVCASARKYDEARDALWDYLQHYKRGGPEWRKRLWQLYRGYILFLIDHGVIDEGLFKGAPRIYAATLERQIKELVDDRPVGGAGILILKILQWLRAEKYSEVIASSDRLRQHASRYLRNPQTARTGAFLRMLAILPTAEFDAEEARARGAAIWERHSEAHEVLRDTAEIIPYEDLWEIVLELLT